MGDGRALTDDFRCVIGVDCIADTGRSPLGILDDLLKRFVGGADGGVETGGSLVVLDRMLEKDMGSVVLVGLCSVIPLG